MSVALAILAGGRGERLGGMPKGLLRLGGRTLIEAQLELGAAFDETLIVANDPEPYRGLGARIVSDVVLDRGAPGGVHAALAHARSEWVLVVACDMPFVTSAICSQLLDARGAEVDVVAYRLGGALEPLPSLWRRALVQEVARKLGEQPSLRAVCQAFRLRLLEEDTLGRVDPQRRATVSVNRPEDLDRLGVGWPESGRRP